MILTPLQKLPKNEEDWGKLIVAKGFKKLPQVQSGHTLRAALEFSAATIAAWARVGVLYSLLPFYF